MLHAVLIGGDSPLTRSSCRFELSLSWFLLWTISNSCIKRKGCSCYESSLTAENLWQLNQKLLPWNDTPCVNSQSEVLPQREVAPSHPLSTLWYFFFTNLQPHSSDLASPAPLGALFGLTLHSLHRHRGQQMPQDRQDSRHLLRQASHAADCVIQSGQVSQCIQANSMVFTQRNHLRMPFSEVLVKQCVTGYEDGNRLQTVVDGAGRNMSIAKNSYRWMSTSV